MAAFRDTINFCELDDIGYQGLGYTRAGMKAGGAKIQCHLNRVLANQQWQDIFSWSKVVV